MTAANAEAEVFVDSEDFATRARRLVMRGFEPKDAVEITLREISSECKSDPSAIKKAEQDAEIFLHRVKEGLI